MTEQNLYLRQNVLVEPVFNQWYAWSYLIAPATASMYMENWYLKLMRSFIATPQIHASVQNNPAMLGGPFINYPIERVGEHSDLNIRTKLAHLIRLKGRSILCVADSNNSQPKLYDHLRDLIGKLNVLFIGMECDGAPLTWLYGPLLTKSMPRKMDLSRRLDGSNFERAIDMVKRFAPQQVYVYAMGQEPWLLPRMSISYTETSRPIVESNKLVQECNRQGLISERLFGKKEIILSV